MERWDDNVFGTGDGMPTESERNNPGETFLQGWKNRSWKERVPFVLAICLGWILFLLFAGLIFGVAIALCIGASRILEGKAGH